MLILYVKLQIMQQKVQNIQIEQKLQIMDTMYIRKMVHQFIMKQIKQV